MNMSGGPDLSTTYLGLELRSPLVASASPVTGRLDSLVALERAGIGAVVLPSLWEEQIEHEESDLHALLEHGTHAFAEAMTWLPELDDIATGPERYLEQIDEAKGALGVPVIASLNGISPGGWVRYAKLCEEAGADALELNVYAVETDTTRSATIVEQRTLALVRQVREAVTLPLAVKVGPFYSSFAHFAAQLAETGVDGIVLFNRFVQPDIDLETLQVEPRVHLSQELELLLPLRWTAILHGRVPVSLAGTGGVRGWEGLLKLLLAGADAVAVASVLLRRGPAVVAAILAGLQSWMEERDYASVRQLQGSLSQTACPDPAAFERASYMQALVTYAPVPDR
jgi:dihydroorotate dehydrogenase (fumarate)